ncbi:uncharacterized protein LOC143298326 [Babylonia areolata]|uniref:uncharacterized protein LOC143298326 n=1 Tax=Babylonia areolata TaxID=304850 RepID=UPI003FD0C420
MFSDSDSEEEENLISESLRNLKNHSLYSQGLFSPTQSQTASPPSSQRSGRLSLKKTGRGPRSSEADHFPDLQSSKQPKTDSFPAPSSRRPARQHEGSGARKGLSSGESGSSGRAASDSDSSPYLDPPVMMSLNAGCPGKGEGRGVGGPGGSSVESVDSSEDVVVAETSEEEADSQAESTVEERTLRTADSPAVVSTVAKQSHVSRTPSTGSLSAARTVSQTVRQGAPVSTPKALPTTSSVYQGTVSGHLPSPICPLSAITPDLQPAQKPMRRIQTMWVTEAVNLDDIEDDSEEEYYISTQPRRFALLHSTPVSMHPVAHADQQTLGKPLPCDFDNEDSTLPQVAFSSKRKKNESNGCALAENNTPTASKTGEKRLINEASRTVQSRHELPKTSVPESCSSDTEIEPVSSENEEDDNLHQSHEISTASKDYQNLCENSILQKKTSSEVEKTTGQSSSTGIMEAETQQFDDSDAATVVYEESTMECSQMSPSILEQETQAVSGLENTEDHLDRIRITNVISLNPHVFKIQIKNTNQTHSNSGAVPDALCLPQESSSSSGTQLVPGGSASCDSSARGHHGVAEPHLKHEDSDMTQPYVISDSESSQEPPSLAAIPSIPSMLGRQVSGDSLPPPLLTKVSSSIVPDSSSSAGDGNNWPALSCSASEKKKTEGEIGDRASSLNSAGSCDWHPQPPLVRLKEDVAPEALSETVTLPTNGSSSFDSQDTNAGQNGVASHADEHSNLSKSQSTGESMLSQEYPTLLPEKQGALENKLSPGVSTVSKPCEEDDGDSDSSQCLFDDLPTHPAEQTKGPDGADHGTNAASTNAAEINVSDVEEDVPLVDLVKSRVLSSSFQQQGHSADQNPTSASAQQSESVCSEVIPGPLITESGAPVNSSAAPVSHVGVSVSDTMTLVKEEPVGYTVEDDFVMVFDSDEEEMFTSYTQVEVTQDASDEDDSWSDELTERQLLEMDEIDIDHDKDDDIAADSDEDSDNTRNCALSSDAAMDSADDDDLWAAAEHAELDKGQAEKLHSPYSQPTLIDDGIEDISTDDDVYLIETQIDDDGNQDTSLNETQTVSSVFLNETQVDSDMIGLGDTDRHKSLSHEAAQDAEENRHMKDDFDDDMDDVLYASATQLDSENEPSESKVHTAGEGDVQSESQQKLGSGTSKESSFSSSRSDISCHGLGSDLIDLTVESSDEQSVTTEVDRKKSVREDDDQDLKSNSDAGLEKDEDVSMNFFDMPTLVDESWPPDSDDDSHHSSEVLTQNTADSEGKDIYGAQTVDDGGFVVSDEDEDFYSVATQKDVDPYLAQTQIDRETVTVSEESDLDTQEEQSDRSTEVNESVRERKDMSASKSDSSMIEKRPRRHSAESDTGSQPAGDGVQKRARRHSAESDTGSQPAGDGVQKRARRHSAESDTGSQPAGDGVQKRARRHSAESDTGSQGTAGTHPDHSFVKICSWDAARAKRTFDSARDTMIKINQRNIKGHAIEIEPQPEARRTGRKLSLQQKLCRSEAPKSVAEREPGKQRSQSSSSTEADQPARNTSKQLKDCEHEMPSEWLKKLPMSRSSIKRPLAKAPQTRKRRTAPATPDISENIKKAKQQLKLRAMKPVRVGHRQDIAPHGDPDMDMDVELPSTQEVFDKGLPLITAIMPVSKKRLMRPATTEEDVSSDTVNAGRSSTAETDIPVKRDERKKDKVTTEPQEHKKKTLSSQKQGESHSHSSIEESDQSGELSSKNKRKHTESRHAGNRASSKTSQDSLEKDDTVERLAKKHKKTEDSHKHHDKVAHSELISRSRSRTDETAVPSTSRSAGDKNTDVPHDREGHEKPRDRGRRERSSPSSDKKPGEWSKSGRTKHSPGSQPESAGLESDGSSKSGTEEQRHSDKSKSGTADRKHRHHAKSGDSSKSRPSDRKHSSDSQSSSISKHSQDKSRLESLAGKADSYKVASVEGKDSSCSRLGSASVTKDADSRQDSTGVDDGSVSSGSGNSLSASFSKLKIPRPPTPPRTSFDSADKPDENPSINSEKVQPDLDTHSAARNAQSKPKTVRFDLQKNVVKEIERIQRRPQPVQPAPHTLPTFQEMLCQNKPPSTHTGQPFFQGNPLLKRPPPLQEQQQQQQQQHVFRPLVPAGSRAARPTGQENVRSGQQRLLEAGDFLTDVLAFRAEWFSEYERFMEKEVNMKADKRTMPPVVKLEQLYPLVTTYRDRIEEYQDIIFKLLKLETWEELFKSWRERKKKMAVCHVFLTGTTAPRINFNMEWTGLLTGGELHQRQYPAEGDLVMMDMKGRFLPSGSPSQKGGVASALNQQPGQEIPSSQLAFVERVVIVKCQDVRSFLSAKPEFRGHPALKQSDRDLWIYKASVKMRYRRFSPNKDSLSTIKPVGCLTSALRRYTALQMLPRSPLMPNVLYPTALASDFHTPAALLERSQFNEEQCTAVQMMLSAALQPGHVSKLCLLQGPPGTGKSHVLVGLVLKILEKNEKARISLSAPSNAAVDELLRRLVRRKKTDKLNFSVVRIGNVDSIHEEVKEFALDNRVKRARAVELQKKKMRTMPQSVKTEHERLTKKIEKLKKEIENSGRENNTRQVEALSRELHKLQKEKGVIDRNQEHISLDRKEIADISASVLKQAQVVCGTLSSFGHPRSIDVLCRNPADNRRSANHFTCTIIDEATQATELDSLIPLQYGGNKLFLVGDPDQLPPTVLSAKAQSLNFGLSMFERLYKFHKDQEGGERSVVMLRTQYRMDPAICTFPNHHVYQGLLRTDQKIKEYCQKFPLHPYMVFDVQEGQELQSQSGTVSNELEAECTAVLCEELTRSNKKITAQSIGIICPYAGQKRLVVDKLRARNLKGVEVNTVDGFQGREKHIIILSCVRARSSTGGIGFMADRRRMNVALTRAKYALYVIAHLQSLRSDGEWKSLVRDAEERGLTRQVHSVEDFPRIFRQCCVKRPAARSDT